MTNVTKTTDPKTDFWKLNPQLQYISPFNKLKEIKNSSHYMWAVFFMSEPDEEINRFYRYSISKRKENINNLYDIDWTLPILQECIEAYPYECLNSVQRALKDELDSLKDRTRLIRDTKLTLDYTDPDTGKTIKGTTSQIDGMRMKSGKIYDQLEEAINKFTKQKDDDVRVYGGRQQSASEKQLL
jgi:hypothetical protein